MQTADPNWFLLLALLLYSEQGFPLYEDTDLGRATAHQLYCLAIEIGFGANGSGSNWLKTKLPSSSRQGEEEGEGRQGRAKEELVEGGGGRDRKETTWD